MHDGFVADSVRFFYGEVLDSPVHIIRGAARLSGAA